MEWNGFVFNVHVISLKISIFQCFKLFAANNEKRAKAKLDSQLLFDYYFG